MLLMNFITDKSEGFIFYLMALPMLVHPLIIFRLLKHRLLTSLRSENGENRSRASSAGNEESLRLRRQNDSSPSLNVGRSLKGLSFLPLLETPSLHSNTDYSASPSPSFKSKRTFRFSSLRRKKTKAPSENTFSSSHSDTSEADIVAFQRELQNLPAYPVKVNFLRTCIIKQGGHKLVGKRTGLISVVIQSNMRVQWKKSLPFLQMSCDWPSLLCK